MNEVVLACLIIINVLWSIVGFICFLDIGGDIDDKPLYKQIVIYFMCGPLLWIIATYIYIVAPYIIDTFMVWREGRK